MRAAVLTALALAMITSACSAPEREARPEPAASAQWRELAPALSARTEVAAAAAGTRIYVVGGYRADGGTVATVEVFDTTTRRWERGPKLPVAVHHAMATTVDGAVHIFGGYRAGRKVSDAVFRLERGAWREVAAMPEGRAAGTAVAVGRRVYLAGGVGPGRVLANRMLVYDTKTGAWSTEKGPPTPREHLGGAGFGGRVYTVGGRTQFPGTLGAFEVFDPDSRTWTRLDSLPTPRGGLGAAAVCTGHIAAVGGEQASGTFAEAEAYDIGAGRWQTLSPLRRPRHGLGVVAVGTSLYALAGGPEPGLHVSRTTEAIELAQLGRC